MDWAVAAEVKVIWDIHAFMGGSSNGTFNGIWPRVPMFWQETFKIGKTNTTLSEAGLRVARALIEWTEGLSEERLQAVAGLTLMNEPAHLSWGGSKGWANKDAMLDWLAAASDLFRQSTLPQRGVRLYVNLVETAFAHWGGDFSASVPGWWRSTFSADERRQWAVMDRHKYYAWDPSCSGCDGKQCPWSCSTSRKDQLSLLGSCVYRWQQQHNEMFPAEDGLRAVSEFSASTYRDASIACRDIDLTRSFLEEQVISYREAGVEPFFWSWRIPYGPMFETGWSLKFLAGVEEENLTHRCLTPSEAPDQSAEQATA
jgi:hypothetical protein